MRSYLLYSTNVTVYFLFSIKENDHRFTQESPTIYNTYCEKPAYQFLPFNQKKDTIPEFAVVFNGRPDHSTYIGRLTKRDVDQLCQILYRGTEFVGIKPILYDDADIDLNDENIEVSAEKTFFFFYSNIILLFHRFSREKV